IPGVARFRVNAYVQRGSIALAFRVLPFKVPTIEQLGLPVVCQDLVMKPKGLVLVTGPTGSGKSSTLAAMINYLNDNAAKRIITIEDPIEYLHPNRRCNIVQREVGRDTNSFAEALRRALRQNPDVILIGEMRDLETISIALTAAETGHLVLATLHTNGAAEAVDRIVDVFPSEQQNQIRMQVSLVMEGILSQFLMSRVGETGRVAVIEVLLASPAVCNLIRAGKTQEIPTYVHMGRDKGMQGFEWALSELVRKGLITQEAAMARAHKPQELANFLQRQTQLSDGVGGYGLGGYGRQASRGSYGG
ncbi:MAG: PilT/PilU family type 4a pilus ATPase, partial [Chloroflexi bacterium]|nr:PilT/PilU family type 4a pilus ATPase [Chloroflexota bacterium]